MSHTILFILVLILIRVAVLGSLFILVYSGSDSDLSPMLFPARLAAYERTPSSLLSVLEESKQEVGITQSINRGIFVSCEQF